MESTNTVPAQHLGSCMKKPKEIQNQGDGQNPEDNPIKENVKFSADETFTSEDGGDQTINEEHARDAKAKATPAFFKRQQATKHLVVNSPTDHFFSPITQKLLLKKRNEGVQPVDVDEED